MIIAAALEGGCGILLSEDIQHGQLVDERLTIRSVFISSD
jgi:predicted nucleic acid-binding protein